MTIQLPHGKITAAFATRRRQLHGMIQLRLVAPGARRRQALKQFAKPRGRVGFLDGLLYG
jgi:hypothetical protein